MKLIFVWIFILYASIVACRDGGDVPMRTPDFQPPVVTGLYVTNDFVIVETWRNPSGGEISGRFPALPIFLQTFDSSCQNPQRERFGSLLHPSRIAFCSLRIAADNMRLFRGFLSGRFPNRIILVHF